MRILFVIPDLPERSSKGYQVRTAEFAAWLRRAHDVIVVAARDGSAADISATRSSAAPRRMRAALIALARGWPLQSAVFDGADVARSVLRISQRWSPDVAVVVTERLPFTTFALAKTTPVVLDVVDAFARNMAQRARNAASVAAWLWRWEARAFSRLSRDLIPAVAATVVTAERERAAYPMSEVIPVGARRADDQRPQPDYDIAFTGNLWYWPNDQAAVEVATKIVPRIRNYTNPRVIFAGRRPSSRVRALCRQSGIRLLADVDDMPQILRSSRLALAPLRHATGTQIKVLEAIAVGTPVLAYAPAVEGLPAGVRGVLICDDPEDMAQRAIEFLRGDLALSPHLPRELTWEGQSERFEALLRRVASDRRSAASRGLRFG